MKKTYIKPTSKLHNLRQQKHILTSAPNPENDANMSFSLQTGDNTYSDTGGIFGTKGDEDGSYDGSSGGIW